MPCPRTISLQAVTRETQCCPSDESGLVLDSAAKGEAHSSRTASDSLSRNSWKERQVDQSILELIVRAIMCRTSATQSPTCPDLLIATLVRESDKVAVSPNPKGMRGKSCQFGGEKIGTSFLCVSFYCCDQFPDCLRGSKSL